MSEHDYIITDEIRALALQQVQQMKEHDVSKRLFTNPMKSVIQNATNNRFKTEVNDCLAEKLEDWQGEREEYLVATQTIAYAIERMLKNPSSFSREDYIEYLTARVIAMGLEQRVSDSLRDKLSNVFGVDVDDMVIL